MLGPLDDAVMADALSARYFALWGPGHADERLAAARDALALADRVDRRDLALDALTWTAMDELERGDRDRFEVCATRHAHLAEQARHPLYRYDAAMWQAMQAALDGRFADAVAGADHAFDLGATLTELAMPRRTVALLVVLREQDRLAELVEATDRIVRDLPLFRSSWGAGRALVHVELGDEAPAREVLARSPLTRTRLLDFETRFPSALSA